MVLWPCSSTPPNPSGSISSPYPPIIPFNKIAINQNSEHILQTYKHSSAIKTQNTKQKGTRICRQSIQNTKPSKGYDVKEKRKLPKLIFLVIGDSGDEGIIDVEDPSISAITFKGTALGKVHDALLDRPLGINFVLSGGNVFANVANAFLRHHMEESDVVKLDVQSPAFAVVFKADFEAISGPLAQNVPV